jgi:TatD DNase family protein
MAASAADLAALLESAAAGGVSEILTASTSLDDLQAGIDTASASGSPRVWAAAGIHPHEAKSWAEGHEEAIEAAARNPRVVAIGETGLDYHYDFSPRDTQREVLARQVRLAVKAGLPIIIHCREAADDVLSVLEGEGGRECGGVIHCFTESAAFAARCLDLGFYISFSGIITFRTAADLREVARSIPESRLLVETDSPYLAPVPHRGKRNEPRLVRLVLEALAAERKTDPAALARTVEHNFHTLFPRTTA